jgi:hypothetical protein
MLLSVTRRDIIERGVEDITTHDPPHPRGHFHEERCFRRDHMKDLMLWHRVGLSSLWSSLTNLFVLNFNGKGKSIGRRE